MASPRRSTTTGRFGSSGAYRAPFNPNFLYSLVPVHALLWEKGKAIDLGDLGGKTGQAGGNIAYDMIVKTRWLVIRTCPATQPFTLFSGPGELGCGIWAHSPGT